MTAAAQATVRLPSSSPERAAVASALIDGSPVQGSLGRHGTRSLFRAPRPCTGNANSLRGPNGVARAGQSF